jgi:hypothetical protein
MLSTIGAATRFKEIVNIKRGNIWAKWRTGKVTCIKLQSVFRETLPP